MLGTSSPPDRPRLLGFGVFEADLRSGELRKRGAKIRLHDKPFQILAALLEEPGEVVSRETLCHRLWPATAYGEFDSNLNSAVRKLRRALGESADSPRFVETLPRRGYRFIAPVQVISREPRESSDAFLASSKPQRPSQRRVSPALLGLGALLVAASIFAALQSRSVAAPEIRRKTTQDPAGQRSRAMLAVLPFENLDADPQQEYFCDGLTEEMIAQLGRLDPDRLGVIARTSSNLYKASDKDAGQIGAELGVDYLLEGSVRSANGNTRITAQLIQVTDQTHLWSEIYDTVLEDLLAVQGEVSVEVATVLALELLPDRPLAQARSSTRNTEAYEHFLRGRHEWNRFTDTGYRQAIVHFERAVGLDASYAAAWAGLANAYSLLSFSAETLPRKVFPKAREAAETAIALDHRLAEGHAALGFIRLYFDYDLEGADEAMRRALELRPNYALAYHWWAGALSALERHDEAIDAMAKAVELDPLSLSVQSDAGWYFLFAGRPLEALEECEQTLAVMEYGWARSCLMQGLVETGQFSRAFDWLQSMFQDMALEDSRWRKVLSLEDPEMAVRAAHEIFLEEKQRQDPDQRYPVDHAFLQAFTGDLDGAFSSLEKALELRGAWLVFVKVDPRFGPLREDPRFGEFVRRVGI